MLGPAAVRRGSPTTASRPFVDLLARVGAARTRRSWSTSAAAPGELTARASRRGGREPGSSAWTPRRRCSRAARGPGRRAAGSSGCRPTSPPGIPPAGVDVLVTQRARCSGCRGTWTCCRAGSSALAPGGWFAMQVPGNFDAPSHALMREVAAAVAAGRRADAGAARRCRRSPTPAPTPRRWPGRLQHRRVGDDLPARARPRGRAGVAGAGVGRGHRAAAGARGPHRRGRAARVPRRRTRGGSSRHTRASRSARSSRSAASSPSRQRSGGAA